MRVERNRVSASLFYLLNRLWLIYYLLSVHEECLSYYFLCFPCLLTFLCHWCLWYVLPRLMEVCSSVSISLSCSDVVPTAILFSQSTTTFTTRLSCGTRMVLLCHDYWSGWLWHRLLIFFYLLCRAMLPVVYQCPS